MFVVICYLNAGRCIWTNFCDVISIRRLASQSKTTSTCWWNGLFGFAGNYCLLMDWSVLLNLCLFAIQNCFLTFIKVLVNRTWLMDWLRCAKRMASLHFSRSLVPCMTWKIWFMTDCRPLSFGWTSWSAIQKSSNLIETKTIDLVWGKIRRLDYRST